MTDQVCEKCGETANPGMTVDEQKQYPPSSVHADADFAARIKTACDAKNSEEAVEYLQRQLFEQNLLARRAQSQEAILRGELYTLRALRDGIFRTLGFEPPK